MAQIRGKLRQTLVSLAALSLFVLCVLAIPRSHSISGANRLLTRRDLPEDECSNVRHIPRTEQCEFVKQHCSEDENTFIDYMQVYYCSKYTHRPFLLIMLLMWLLTLFMTLGIAASDFLCPNLGTISSLLGMSESLAGVTFLAFGNGSPDLFSTYSSMKIGSGSLAIGELIGAASFITAVVVGAMALARPFKVARKSFIRDIGFFTAAVLCTMAFISDGKLRRSECILMLVIYLVYVATVVSWHYHYTKKRQAYLSEIRAREFFLDAGQEANVVEDEEVGESSNSVLQDGFDREGFLSLTNSDETARNPRSPVKSPQSPAGDNLSPNPHPHAPHGRSLSPHGRLPDRGRGPMGVERLRDEHAQTRSYSPLANRSSPNITPVHSHPHSHTHSHRNIPRIVTHNLELDEQEEEDRYSGLTSSMRLPTPLHTTHRIHDSAAIRPSLYGALDFRDRINKQDEGDHPHSDLLHSPLTRRLDTELSPVPSSIEPMWSNVKEVTESAWVVALFPTLTDFRSKSFIGMVTSVITSVPVFFLSITIPVVESVVEEPQVPNASEPVSAYSDNESFVASPDTATSNPLLSAESENKVLYNMARRNKILVIVQAMLAPPVINILMLDEIPGVWGTLFCIICSLGLMYLAATNYDSMVQSGQYRFLAFFGFLTSIAWVSHIADVVVGVLKALGAILGISDPVLGLTVFAFGNSLGDLIANTTIAKMGFPMMALSACFGGPLLNVLVGVGVSGLIVTSSPGNAVKNGSYHIEISGTLIISAATLFLTLVITMVMVPLARWHMTKTIGITIISIWTVSTMVNVIFI